MERKNSLFSQILTERPTEVYQGTTVSSEDQALLNNWFLFREVNDEDDVKFLHFWHRNLNLYYDRYLLMLEAELQEIPDLAKASYIEAIHNLTKNTGSVVNTHSGSDTTTNTGTDTMAHTGTVANDGEHDNTLSRTGTVGRDKTGYDTNTNSGTVTTLNTGTQKNEQTKDANHSDVSLVGPQSASYPNATAGQVPNLDWSYVSNQNQSKDNNGEQTRTDNLSTQTTDATSTRTDYDTLEIETNNLSDRNVGTDGNVTTYNNNDTRTANLSNETEYNSVMTSENDLENASDTMRAGRNELESDIRRKIYEFVGGTIAFKWFYDKLDVCFMGVYD